MFLAGVVRVERRHGYGGASASAARAAAILSAVVRSNSAARVRSVGVEAMTCQRASMASRSSGVHWESQIGAMPTSRSRSGSSLGCVDISMDICSVVGSCMTTCSLLG